MKKILIPIGALLVSGLAHAQLSTTENYVYTKTYLDYNTTNGQPTKTSETVQYFDGLGRPKQVVNIKASPQGKDVVTPILYDEFGRQLRDYLPVPQSTTANGAIYPQTSGNFPVGDPTGVYPNERAFSEKILENSPLDRILQQKQVGQAWSEKPVQFDYDVNTTQDAVKKYTTVTSWENGATKSTISQSTVYGDAQLYKNTVTDEDGNPTIEFKNGRGQVLLVRKMLSATEKADTYYVYNEYNQLAFVIPPLASVIQSLLSSDLENLCYQYKYDGRGRLVEKRLPGKGWEYMVYDKQNRLAMTQDANMGASKQWLFTKYDKFGRIAYTGIYTSTANYDSAGRANEQANVDSKGSNNVARTITVGFTGSGMNVYYDNTAANNFPNTITKLLSINYYDNLYDMRYSFTPDLSQSISQESLLYDAPDQDGKSTKGLPVMSLVKNIEDDDWTKNYVYYDKRGRVVGNYSINHLGGRTEVASKLDFSGVVQQSITRHKRLSTDIDRIITENFTYDSQNRLLSQTHQVDSNPVEYLAQNSYNELSQLSGKKVGGISPSVPLQDISYSYNIRGWMTKINDPKNLGSKLFGYEIKYNQVEGLEIPNSDFPDLTVKAKYNGNIAEVDWKVGTEQNASLKRYGYSYDALNRLKAGFYQKAGSETAKEYFEKLDYDANGNIIRLKRSEGIVAGSSTAMMIDNLKYDYIGNRLTKVTEEQTGNSKGYPYIAAPNVINYDANGNMTNLLDKGISEIVYNFLNLPVSITTNPTTKGRSITSYTYRADGIKVGKSFYKNAVTNYTSYLDGFQYKFSISSMIGTELQFVPTSEGYYSFPNNSYIYNYTDHLGNVRLSYFKNGSSIEVLEENNYYPFGLLHNYTATTTNSYQYKYNGKELQETGMYDYGARFYMPDIGRWGVVDPLAEKYRRWSPYTYAVDNPIRFTDPDGRGTKDVIIKGPKAQETLEQLQNSVKGQLTLKMDENGKVTAETVKGAKLTKASKTFLNATQDRNNTVLLKTFDGYRYNGVLVVGGGYRGSITNGVRTVGTNVISPLVNAKMDQALGIKDNAGTLHEVLESYMGILNHPGSPAATSEENKKLGYYDAHEKANTLDPRMKSPGTDFTQDYKRIKRHGEENKLYYEDEVFYINNKTNERISFGKYIFDPQNQ